jgi:hypothetical protein
MIVVECPVCQRRFNAFPSQKRVFCSARCRNLVRSENMRLAKLSQPMPPAITGARWIPLTKGKFALVDQVDYDRVISSLWFYHICGRPGAPIGYAARRLPGRSIEFLHRVLIEAKADQDVDHKSRDPLDCRRENLRIATDAGNNANRRKHARKDATSKYKGVCRKEGRWYTLITFENRTRTVGKYDTEVEAAVAYDAAALHHFGEFACTNFDYAST